MTPAYTPSRSCETPSQSILARNRHFEDKYQKALEDTPAPGNGSGFHRSMMTVANYAALAGTDPGLVFYDLRKIADAGTRKVADGKIREAIEKAYRERGTADLLRRYGVDRIKPPKPQPVIDGKRFLRETCKRGREIIGERRASEWFLERSPVQIPAIPELPDGADIAQTSAHVRDVEAATRAQLCLFIETMFNDWPGAFVFLGGPYAKGTLELEAGDRCTLRTWPQWCKLFTDRRLIPEHIGTNPLTGRAEPKRSGTAGETTRRGTNCIAAHHYALIEFDNISKGQQAAFWAAVRLPLAALVYTGNKSLHGWIKVDCLDRDAWNRDVVKELYRRRLEPAGIDGQCKNPDRLARPPGAIHHKTLRPAQLIYLDPAARLERGTA